MMFWNNDERQSELESEIERLEAKLREAKNDLADVEHKKKIEEEDIKHMVRMKEERLEVEHERKLMESDRKKEEAIAVVKDQYREKLEARLMKETENIREMYSEILTRLPDVNVKLKGDV